MTLTIAVVLSVLMTGVLAYAAWRSPPRFTRVATLVAVGTPLMLLMAVMRRGRSDARSTYSLQIVGQYAFLLDTVRIGAGPGVDVHIPAPGGGRGGSGPVSVYFRPNDSSFVVRAGSGAPPGFPPAPAARIRRRSGARCLPRASRSCIFSSG